MANAPFPPFQGDFESLARQYWNTWNELLGRSGTFDGWGLGATMPPGLGRLDPTAFDWYQRMQRLASDFSGGGSAADVAAAWRTLMGGEGTEPFVATLRAMHGGLAGGQWIEQVRPMLEALLRPLRQQNAEWLQRPTFGPAREHQERLQALALAWQEWEERNDAFNALLSKVGQEAFARFERMLEGCEKNGRSLESARALFDLWIDAAEEAWAELALSDEYRRAYGEMTNALMRLRLGLQREAEQFASLLGLPGRTEVDALARKVADLERALHAARRGAAKPAAAQASQQTKGKVPVAKPARQQAPAKAAAKELATAAIADAKPAPAKAGKRKARAPGKVRKAATVAKKTTARRAVSETVASGASLKAPAKVAPKTAAQPKPASESPAAAKARPKAQAIVAAEAGAATRQAVAKPAARKAPPRPAKPAAAAKAADTRTATGKATAARSASKRTAAAATRGKASAKPAGTAPATSKTAGKPARRAAAEAAPAAKVVSIKDWVSRNLAATSTGRRGGSR
ncbi:poly(R)-hydroxyalkanoic acid synthase subunit PhaE [Pseudoxanthomonas suwonensis]|uniref:poly(R)-hydroxyalkanoic acid synthase subunit PhaE n=1 Tax=Pseudoxanthomonas suwonensis TaxID=314722 RepID=UPI0004639B26|nr:poly(R)-hydroxyalkanoic acid synthase subunit PhaE [Pseudoxanthomonas suwonensis]